jgi:hypothetical protein
MGVVIKESRKPFDIVSSSLQVFPIELRRCDLVGIFEGRDYENKGSA